jgi:hypothetical protein
LDLYELAIKVAGHERLTQQFHAMHPLTGSRLLENNERVRFDVTSAVVSGDLPP